MINKKRLTWFLEFNYHISRFKSGFRTDRSTTDNLVRLETFIPDAFIKGLRFLLTTLTTNWGISKKSTYIHETSINKTI